MMTPQGKEKIPLRVHLESLAQGLLDTPDKLGAIARLASEPPLPPLASDVWAVFIQLHMRRPQSEFGPMRLPWSEVEAYSRVAGVRLNRWRVAAIFALDDEFFAVQAESKK